MSAGTGKDLPPEPNRAGAGRDQPPEPDPVRAASDPPTEPDRVVAGSDLPPELARLVDETLDASGLTGPRRREVEAELVAHFEDGLARGLAAETLAQRFGDPRRAGAAIATARRGTDRTYDRGRTTMGWDEIAAEVRHAVRTLARAPGFAALVVVTLALGVGANTAVFTVLDATLLAPLPYQEPDRLVRLYDVWEEDPTTAVYDYLRAPAVSAWREWDEVFEGVAAVYTYRETGADLTDQEQPERVVTSSVMAGYFETLGVAPMLGRTFRDDESFGPGEPSRDEVYAPVAILAYDLWTRRYGADRSMVGRTIRLDGVAYEVVGVMPQGFTNPIGSPPDLWLAQDMRLGGFNNWGNFYLTGIARLRDGLTIEAARARLEPLAERLETVDPDAEGWDVGIEPLQADLVGERRSSLLWILAAAVGLVLLSACVNVANLVFARSLARDRDVALRGALGSGRGRLVLHLLVESAVLAVAGGVAGLALGWAGVHALLALAPDALPTVADPGLSGRVFVFALGATVVALAAFGLAPALRTAATPPVDVLRAGGRSATDTRGMRRTRSGLVIVQVAVAVTLIVGAGLLVRSFAALQRVPLAVDGDGVLTFEVHLPPARYPDGPARHAFHEGLHERLAGLSGVETVGATSWLPVNGRYHSWGANWPDDAEGLDDEWIDVDVRVFAGDIFGALGIDLVRGADPGELDPAGEPVMWINGSLATRLFGELDPLGEIVQIGGSQWTVAGLIEDVPHSATGTVANQAYLPHAFFADNRNWALIQVVKAAADPATLVAAARAELATLDPDLVLYRVRPFDRILATARAQDRFATTLMATFAGLALALAAVGTYGVLAGTVARRRREIGVRMALGAAPGQVREMVLGSAATLVGAGLVLGLGAAWAASRWLESLLFEIEPLDPASYAGGALVMLILGLVSAWLPARRATRVDPATSLTAE